MPSLVMTNCPPKDCAKLLLNMVGVTVVTLGFQIRSGTTTVIQLRILLSSVMMMKNIATMTMMRKSLLPKVTSMERRHMTASPFTLPVTLHICKVDNMDARWPWLQSSMWSQC